MGQLGENPVPASLNRRVPGRDARDPASLFSRFRSERGQGVVEFAAVLPLIAALVIVLVDFGKAIYYYIDLTHVANEGARIASVSQAMPKDPSTGNPYPNLGAYICSQLGDSGKSELRSGSSGVDAAKVEVSYGTAAKDAGDPVTVKVSTKYHWIPFFGGGSMTIAGSATMRIEYPPSASGITESGGTCT